MGGERDHFNLEGRLKGCITRLTLARYLYLCSFDETHDSTWCNIGSSLAPRRAALAVRDVLARDLWKMHLAPHDVTSSQLDMSLTQPCTSSADLQPLLKRCSRLCASATCIVKSAERKRDSRDSREGAGSVMKRPWCIASMEDIVPISEKNVTGGS